MSGSNEDERGGSWRRPAAVAAALGLLAAVAWVQPYVEHWPLWTCAAAAGVSLLTAGAPGWPNRRGALAALMGLGLVAASIVPAAGWLRTMTAGPASLDSRLRDAVALEVYRSRQGGSILAANDPDAWRRIYVRTAEEQFRIRGVEGVLLCQINPDLDVRTNEGMSYVPSDHFAQLYGQLLVRRWTVAWLLALLWFVAMVPLGRRGGASGVAAPAAPTVIAIGTGALAVGATLVFALVPMWKPSLLDLSPWWLAVALGPSVGLVLRSETTSPPRG